MDSTFSGRSELTETGTRRRCISDGVSLSHSELSKTGKWLTWQFQLFYYSRSWPRNKLNFVRFKNIRGCNSIDVLKFLTRSGCTCSQMLCNWGFWLGQFLWWCLQEKCCSFAPDTIFEWACLLKAGVVEFCLCGRQIKRDWVLRSLSDWQFVYFWTTLWTDLRYGMLTKKRHLLLKILNKKTLLVCCLLCHSHGLPVLLDCDSVVDCQTSYETEIQKETSCNHSFWGFSSLTYVKIVHYRFNRNMAYVRFWPWWL